MPTRWEVEKAVRASRIDITGKGILMLLLSLTDANTAQIPPKHAPTFTELEQITSGSRSTLVEWMRALTDAGWVGKLVVEGESRTGYALSVGDPEARRAPRKRAAKESAEALIPDPREAMNSDGACRLAARETSGGMPLGDTDHAARRYGTMPLGDTTDEPLLFRNSPTESSTTIPTLNPHLPSEGHAAAKTTKKRRPPKTEEPREDVQQICEYLAKHVVSTGSKRPTVSEKWRTEARLLLDEERTPKATPERVIALIDWIKTSGWWKARVLSMPKLRSKYDEIRLDALRDFNQKQSRRPQLPAGYESRGTVAYADQQGPREPAEVRKARGWMDIEVPAGGDFR